MDTSQRFNIGAELIERNLRAGRGDAPAILSGGKILSYRDLEALTDRLAAAFLRAGVEPEQRVLFVLPDSLELAAGYLAAMKMGAVAVPCNPLLRPADYAYFVEESRARLLITSRVCFERIEPALSQGSALRRVLVVGETGDRSFERWVADTPAQRVPTAATSRDEPAFWLWTSGSTGRPKAAVHSHQDWPHCCELYGRAVLDLSSSDRCFSASKLFHAYGLGNALAFPLWVGASTATMYFNRREQTRLKMRGEWFFSGDKFRQTEDGEYHYVGRSDDMFKAGAEWVSPTDVEAVLVSHDAVLEAAVIPLREGGLMRPQAHVVLTEGREGTPQLAEELRQHVRSRCAGYMVPKEIHFVRELPKTATGKIQRYLLREGS